MSRNGQQGYEIVVLKPVNKFLKNLLFKAFLKDDLYLILCLFKKHVRLINMAEEVTYSEDNIRSLDWKEHIRMRPGMYIGKLGDGAAYDDGIYILLKEVIDNSIDEYAMGHGKNIDISIKDKIVKVRD